MLLRPRNNKGTAVLFILFFLNKNKTKNQILSVILEVKRSPHKEKNRKKKVAKNPLSITECTSHILVSYLSLKPPQKFVRGFFNHPLKLRNANKQKGNNY